MLIPEKLPESEEKLMRALLIDIETSPITAYVWGLFKQNINIDWVVDSGRVLCFAAKWLGEDEVTFLSEHAGSLTKQAHKTMIKQAHKLLCEADAICHYNGNRFDIPTLNKEFVQYGLTPPSPSAQIDLLRTVRKQFRFPSNKLDFVSKMLGIGRKLKHRGPELWLDCMAGDPAAWAEMEAYNRQDVVVLEALYHRLLPWLTTHPHVGLYNAKPRACPSCGSEKLESRGLAYTKLSSYRRFRCNDCGTWTRSGKRVVGAEMRPVT